MKRPRWVARSLRSRWTQLSSHSIARRILQARPGDIVLLHDGGGDRRRTVAALPAIIEGFLERGLAFETLCD